MIGKTNLGIAMEATVKSGKTILKTIKHIALTANLTGISKEMMELKS